MLARQAKLRVMLESQIKTNQNYSTLFFGLKKNHPHAVALVHPISFLIRRLIYAALIVFMHELPFFVTVILLCLSLALLCFLCVEHQWESALINWQHIVNEVGFYICLVLIFYLSSFGTINMAQSNAIGWTIIGLVITIMIFDVFCFMVFVYKFMRLRILRVYRYGFCSLFKTRKSKKIAPTAIQVEDLDKENKPAQDAQM